MTKAKYEYGDEQYFITIPQAFHNAPLEDDMKVLLDMLIQGLSPQGLKEAVEYIENWRKIETTNFFDGVLKNKLKSE